MIFRSFEKENGIGGGGTDWIRQEYWKILESVDGIIVTFSSGRSGLLQDYGDLMDRDSCEYYLSGFLSLLWSGFYWSGFILCF